MLTTGTIRAILIVCFCALTPAEAPAQAGDLDLALEKISAYRMGDSRAALSEVRRIVNSSSQDPAQRRSVSARLTGKLQGVASVDCKRFLCEELSRIGSGSEIPIIAVLLVDEQLSGAARLAVERIGGPAAAEALLKALPKSPNTVVTIGIINSLGTIGTGSCLPGFAELAAGTDRGIARAALDAIGQIGSPEASQVLAQFKAPEELRQSWANAYLNCADRLLATGSAGDARNIYREIWTGEYPSGIRATALIGAARIDGEQILAELVDEIRAGDAMMRNAAVRALSSISGDEVTRSLTNLLPDLAPGPQVMILGALEKRGDMSVLTQVIPFFEAGDPHVRRAAVRAAGTLGIDDWVLELARAATEEGAVGEEAARALARLKGANVDSRISSLVHSPELGVTVEIAVVLIQALADRGITAAAASLIHGIENRPEEVRMAALKALGALARERELQPMIALMARSNDDAIVPALEEALSRTMKRMPEAPHTEPWLLEALAQADGAARLALLRLLGQCGGEDAFELVMEALNQDDEQVRLAAIQALGNWPTPEPAEALLSLAENGQHIELRSTALQGYIRMAGLDEDREVETTLKMYRRALELADRRNEKRQVLQGIGRVPHGAALRFLEDHIEDSDVSEEALSAYFGLAMTIYREFPEQANTAFLRVSDLTKDTNAELSEYSRSLSENLP